jgi:hypothetical protein
MKCLLFRDVSHAGVAVVAGVGFSLGVWISVLSKNRYRLRRPSDDIFCRLVANF